jgi:hypothetical protein
VRLQQLVFEGGIRMVTRQTFHYIQDQINSLLGHGCHQVVISSLLPNNAMQPETALGCNKPTGRLVHPKGRKTKATKAIRARVGGEIDEVFLIHIHRDQCKVPSEQAGG